RRIAMRRCLIAAGLVVALTGLASTATAQGKDDWATVKGRIIWDVKKKPAPKREIIKVPAPKPVCLVGDLLAEDTLINPKNQGLANVVIWLEPMQMDGTLPVHPMLRPIKEKQVTIDQPCCMFTPRVVALREGQHLLVKNSAAFAHNVRWIGDPEINKGGNVL